MTGAWGIPGGATAKVTPMSGARPHLAGTASGLGGAIMIGGGAALSALAETDRRRLLQRMPEIEIDRRGMQIAVHAIGDGAVRTTIDGYAAARAAGWREDGSDWDTRTCSPPFCS